MINEIFVLQAVNQARIRPSDGGISAFPRLSPQDMDSLPLEGLQQIRHQMQIDINTLDQVTI